MLSEQRLRELLPEIGEGKDRMPTGPGPKTTSHTVHNAICPNCSCVSITAVINYWRGTAAVGCSSCGKNLGKEIPTESTELAWRDSFASVAQQSKPYRVSGDWLRLTAHLGTALVGCIDHHLRRRHTLEFTKMFVKYAHGNHTISNREHVKELYHEFEQWLKEGE